MNKRRKHRKLKVYCQFLTRIYRQETAVPVVEQPTYFASPSMNQTVLNIRNKLQKVSET